MAPATILIVDDKPTNLSLLNHLLRSDYHFHTANSGESSMRAAKTEPRPNLTLLDVMMPEMDGYAVLAKPRANTAKVDVPVVFLTALAEPEAEEHGPLARATGRENTSIPTSATSSPAGFDEFVAIAGKYRDEA